MSLAIELVQDFASMLGAEKEQERIALVKGIITAASAIIPEVCFEDREGRRVRANLFYAVIANAGSNKSRIGQLESLLVPIHEEIRQEEIQRKLKLPKGIARPPSRNVLLTGNITRARVIQHLCANEEVPLMLIDSEMDSITTSMQADNGGFRAELRKAYHHEFISSSKKTDDELLEVKSPHLSMLITGTFDQAVRYLFPITDGFASRHWFDVNLAPTKFALYGNPRGTSPGSTLSLWSSHFYKMWEFYKGRKVQVLFSKQQFELLNDLGVEWDEELAQHEDLTKDFAYRHILMTLKVATILTALKSYLLGDKNRELQCDDEDFKYALELIEHSYSQFQELHALLPVGREHRVSLNKEADRLFALLPDDFSTQEAYRYGKELGKSERQTRNYLKQLSVIHKIQRTTKGCYKKA
jgi:hypothetical protein